MTNHAGEGKPHIGIPNKQQVTLDGCETQCTEPANMRQNSTRINRDANMWRRE